MAYLVPHLPGNARHQGGVGGGVPASLGSCSRPLLPWTGVFLSPRRENRAGPHQKCPCSVKQGSETARRTVWPAGVGAENTTIPGVDEKPREDGRDCVPAQAGASSERFPGDGQAQ